MYFDGFALRAGYQKRAGPGLKLEASPYPVSFDTAERSAFDAEEFTLARLKHQT